MVDRNTITKGQNRAASIGFLVGAAALGALAFFALGPAAILGTAGFLGSLSTGWGLTLITAGVALVGGGVGGILGLTSANKHYRHIIHAQHPPMAAAPATSMGRGHAQDQ